MICLTIFGGCFVIIGLLAIISKKTKSPGQIFTKRVNTQEDLSGKSAVVAGVIYLLVGIAIIAGGYLLNR